MLNAAARRGRGRPWINPWPDPSHRLCSSLLVPPQRVALQLADKAGVIVDLNDHALAYRTGEGWAGQGSVRLGKDEDEHG